LLVWLECAAQFFECCDIAEAAVDKKKVLRVHTASMPKKQSAARRRGIPVAITPLIDRPTTGSKNCSEEHDFVQAVKASKETAEYERNYKAMLKKALEESQQEAQEAEAMRLALEASRASEEERIRAIGLSLKATTNCVNSTLLVPPSTNSDVHAGYVTDSSNAQKDIRVDAVLTTHILKVTFGSHVLRLHAEWSSDALASSVFSCIKDVVEKAFGVTVGSTLSYVLKYHDEEGDLCTLTKRTTMDFLDIYDQQASLKLVIEAQQAPQSASVSECKAANEDIECILLGSGESAVIEDDQNAVFADISIATPPDTPRLQSARTIEEDYDDSWAIIETAP
jgi:hypothetical protein